MFGSFLCAYNFIFSLFLEIKTFEISFLSPSFSLPFPHYISTSFFSLSVFLSLSPSFMMSLSLPLSLSLSVFLPLAISTSFALPCFAFYLHFKAKMICLLNIFLWFVFACNCLPKKLIFDSVYSFYLNLSFENLVVSIIVKVFIVRNSLFSRVLNMK